MTEELRTSAVAADGLGVDIPSLMAKTRLSSRPTLAPTRERVSEAIALVRARQQTVAKKAGTKVKDLSELKNLSGNVRAKKIQMANASTPTAESRSPLTPAGQTGSEFRGTQGLGKPSNFLQSAFSSKSEVPSHGTQPVHPSMSDEPEENVPTRTAPTFMNPMELVKREFQIATQSQSRGSIKAPTVASSQDAPGIHQDDTNDSDDEEVDAKTMQDVSRFLDALDKKTKGTTPEQPIVVDQISSVDTDPIEALRKAASDDFIYGSDDDMSEDSSTGSVNPETLAEIGAFIDAVSKAGSVAPSLSTKPPRSKEEIASFIDAINGVPSEYDDSNIGAKKTPEEVDEIESRKAQSKVSEPSPIYEHVEAMSLEKGSHKDPPAIVTEERTVEMSDPPAAIVPDANEKAMQMREEQAVVAPSYSVESLDMGAIPAGKPTVEDEKKTEEPELEDEVAKESIGAPLDSVSEVSPEEDLSSTKEEKRKDPEEHGSSYLDDADSNFHIEAVEAAEEEYDMLLSQALGSAEENTDVDLNEKFSEHNYVERAQSTGETQGLGFDDESRPEDPPEEDLLDEEEDVVAELRPTGAIELPAVPSMTEDDQSLPWDLRNIASEETMKATGRTRPSVRSKARRLRSLFSDDSSVPNSAIFADEGSDGFLSENEELDEPMGSHPSDPAGRMGTNDETSYEDGEGVVVQDSGNDVKAMSVLQEYDPFTPNNEDHSEVTVVANKGTLDFQASLTHESASEAPSSPSKAMPAPSMSSLSMFGVFESFAVSTSTPQETKESAMEKVEEIDDTFVAAFLQSGSMDKADTEAETAPEESQPQRDENLASSSAKIDKRTEEDEEPKALGFLEQFAMLAFGCEDGRNAQAVLQDDLANKETTVKEIVESTVSSHDFSTADDIMQYFSSLHEKCDSNENERVKKIQIFQKLLVPVTNGTRPSILEIARIRQAAGHADVPLEVVDKFLELAIDEQSSLPSALSSQSETLSSRAEEGNVSGGLNEDEAIAAFLSQEESSPHDLYSREGIAKYFATLDEDPDSSNSSPLMTKIHDFQQQIAPVVGGKTPSVMEVARIRQAATKAMISLDVVDRFLEFLPDEQPTLPAAPSSVELPTVDVDDIEDVNEDEEISAFLKRFTSLQQGGHFRVGKNGTAQETEESASMEEAVEVDATYGYVKKELAQPASEDTQEQEEEWWKEGQRVGDQVYRSDSEGTLETTGKATDTDVIDLAKRETQPSRKSPQDISRESEELRKESLVINTNLSGSFEVADGQDWARKAAMAKYGPGWESHANWLSPSAALGYGKVETIDGVEAAEKLKSIVYSKTLFKNWHPWKRLYRERTKYHPGFFEVDVHSIYDSTVPVPSSDEEEIFIPWERRRVRQRFLHEKSFFSRNWFGDMVAKRGNQRIKEPVCQPKSMEMPMENVPDPGEWTEEWYKSPYDRRIVGTPSSTDNSRGISYSGTETSRDESSYYSGSSSEGSIDDDDDDDMSWEEAPECGELINVKMKIGERVTRVHPDFTSSLRRSRWRKKYFPRGTFPY